MNATLLTIAVAGLLAGSASAVDAQDDPAVQGPSPIAGPVGVIAIGHSGLTGENTDPARPWQPALENSWATGTTPEVRSIYQRLVEVWPQTEGHVANTAQGGAAASTLASQALRALIDVPAPALAIISTIDNDIRCDGSDAAHVPEFGADVTRAIDAITEASPGVRILMTTQLGSPALEVEALSDDPEALVGMRGSGMCDFFDPDGEYRPDRVAALTAIVEGYEAEQARACARYPGCRDDSAADAAFDFDTANISSDGNHWNTGGQAYAAELRWPIVADLLGIATTAPDTAAASATTQPWIAYQTDRGGEGTWLIHPDGSDDHQIAAAFPGDLILPNWSPDGQRLAMTSRATGGVEPLYEYDLASESYQQLFDCEGPCLGDDEPVYSPDGTTMGFIRYLGPITDAGPSDCSLWMGDLASREVWRVTDNEGCDREYFPRWSPDGTQLTYHREQWTLETGTTGMAVFVIDADGTNERQLTEWETMAGTPDWSPDGEWIVYGTSPLGLPEGISNLYRMHPDGTGTEQLTFNEDTTQRATQPRYTPDGEFIVFTAQVVPFAREMWLMPAAGGEPTVVAGGSIHTHPTWQPAP